MSAEKGNIQSLIKNADGVMLNANTLTKKLADNSQKIENILADIEKFSGNISELELKETIESAKKTLTEISNLLASVNEGQGTLGKIVKDESLYTSIDSTINTLNSLLKDVQANPKRYVSLSLIERKDKKK
jgi:phospholipid/cholesterol/gamma-HCH transport system substrate-binding protein